MEIIKVNYRRGWDSEGFYIKQNVTLSENMMLRFNKHVEDCRKLIEKKRCYTNEDIKILSYGKNIEKNQKRCLHLTQLCLLHQFLTQNHIDCSRLKTDRNTMVIVNR